MCVSLSDGSYFILLEMLHLLPGEWRIRFKIATLTDEAKHIGSPSYAAYKVYVPSFAILLLTVSRYNLNLRS